MRECGKAFQVEGRASANARGWTDTFFYCLIFSPVVNFRIGV